ncbi:hypothetical protein HDU96_007086 [Phlyctochytrium bullatum]|nr:hypothetical protein HDU96_007086 [Phlyctochytrium bullatum]
MAEGGAVMELDEIMQTYQDVLKSPNSTAAPPGTVGEFGVPALGSIPAWESYYPSDPQDVPLEWIEDPTDVWIAADDTTDPVGVWKKVAAYLPSTKMPPGTAIQKTPPSGPPKVGWGASVGDSPTSSAGITKRGLVWGCALMTQYID